MLLIGPFTQHVFNIALPKLLIASRAARPPTGALSIDPRSYLVEAVREGNNIPAANRNRQATLNAYFWNGHQHLNR